MKNNIDQLQNFNRYFLRFPNLQKIEQETQRHKIGAYFAPGSIRIEIVSYFPTLMSSQCLFLVADQ